MLYLCLLFLFALSLQGKNNPVLEIPSFEKPLKIKLDGVPDEPFWQKAGKINKFHKFRSPGVPAGASTIARVCLDQQNLYLSLFCHEPGKITRGTEKNSLWNIDHVDMIFSSIEDKDWFVQIAFGLNGKTYEEFIRKEEYQKAILIGKDFWSAELIIPLRAFGKFSDKGLRFNMLRRRANAREYQSWGELVDWALEPYRFGIFHIKTLPEEVAHGPRNSQVSSQASSVSWETAGVVKSTFSYRKGSSGKFISIPVTSTGKFHRVRLEKLTPGTLYQYKISGDENIYSLTTLDPKEAEFSFAFTSDIHGNSALLQQHLTAPVVQKADIFFLAGDLLTGISGHYSCYNGFSDTVSDCWKKNSYCFRGNHEYRGIPAPFLQLTDPFGNISYGAFLHKGTYFLYLDSGDGKMLDTPYMKQQLKFVEKAVASPEFRNARFRILLAHHPLITDRSWSSPEMTALYNVIKMQKAEKMIDLYLCGHKHSYNRLLAGESKLHSTNPRFNDLTVSASYPFPLLINDRSGVILVDVRKDRLNVTVFNPDLKLHDKLSFPAKKR